MKYLIFPALFGLGLVGCSQKQTAVEVVPSQTTMPARPTSAAVASLPPTVAPTPVATPERSSEPATVQPARNIIYQGNLELAVDDFDQASANLDRLLAQYHSYAGTAHETRADGQRRQEMTLKVPPADFLPLVAALSKLGRIEAKDVASADVTADVLQALASLNAKQSTAAKYRQLLAQTTNPAEIHRLEEQTRQLRLDEAADQARLEQFGARSAWATLSLHYYQLLSTAEPDSPLPAFAPRFLAAFSRSGAFMLEIAVALTYLWPLALLGAAGIWGVRRWRLRHPVQE
ncbi:DUF4349 domain-containing protein [Hymenobacter sp. HMF4947]|uniref:DUF4349 domain-containing protein n=1 Tax=Hymenobacter ginkgonis TaxID=2682976 RepID=A0A7K1TAV9_9BACT|nr:DUF4349 domain-containing protein [Hymenobacter ginkgonis]MVN75528.1 DUF4349 domain-containing protein [Hymenobacter ginkgonis]